MLDETGEHYFRQFSFLIRSTLEILRTEFVEFGDFLEHFILVVVVFRLKSVLEDSLALMDEALGDFDGFSAEVLRFAHQQAFNHSGDVSHVEDLVEFACSWRELGVEHDALEQLIDCNDQRFGHAFDFGVELLQVVEQNSEVNSDHCFIGGVAHRDGGEETLGSV